jgi:adenylate kinase
MRLVFLGAPGAGKGTYAAVLCRELKIPTISTGDLLRANVKEQTALGKEAKSYMDRGELVPSELVTKMLAERLDQPDVKPGFILDGYPRTIDQAQSLTEILLKKQQPLTAVVNIDVTHEVIIKRLTGRRMCQGCGANYNVNTNLRPKQEGVCDKCGGQLYIRTDDNAETISHRLKVYEEQTAPLIAFFERAGLLRTIKAEGEINDIVARIEAAVLGAK